MEDRGRNSRTYANSRNTKRRPSGSGPSRRPRTAADRARMRRRRKRQRMMQLVLLIILVIAAIAGIIVWKRYSPSKETYDMKKYYGIEKDGQVGITVDNKVVDAKGKIADGKVYVAYDIVRDYINSRFYWDTNENVLLYMLPKDMISVDVGSTDYSISREKKSEDYVILKTEGNTAYIALDFVQQYTNIDYEVSNNPDHVMIRTKWGKTDVAYNIVRDYINSRFYWDPNENVLLYMLPEDMISVNVGSKDYSISRKKKSEDYVILKTEGNTAYIALDFVQQYTNIDYEVSNNPDHVMIRTKWGKTDVATVKKNTQVRYQGGVKSPVLAELKKKDEVTVVESEQNWKKVRTADGVIGYVKNKALKNEEKKNITRKFEEQDYSNITKDYTINMAWHNVTNQDANNAVAQRIAQTKGLTTLAPTWIHVADTNGNISSIASADYVSYAHKQNVEVWMTVRDFDGGISSEKESYELLSYTSRRETLITQLIAEALRVGVDGINVDFEKISDKCGEHYIEFIRELSVKCRQNGLVLSVDNYVPKSFNTQYDRKEQGIVADYVVIMGYDEYYAGSPEAGPISSYNYVKEGITETLKEVPAEKVISGIPFFTRLWKETPKTEEELKSDKGTDAEQYSTTVESDAYGMDNAQALVKQAGVDTTWDKKAGQNYATWEADGSKYEIWLEDSKSIEAKLKLMKKYKLAGTAEWSLGQESSDIWNLIQKYVN